MTTQNPKPPELMTCVCCGLTSAEIKSRFLIEGGKFFRLHRIKTYQGTNELAIFNKIRGNLGLDRLDSTPEYVRLCVTCSGVIRDHVRRGFDWLEETP
jgi:hypothetical protein